MERFAAKNVWTAGGLCAVLLAAGCASPGVPQPPSLHLPKPVGDLQAQRVGDAVELRWTMPATTTDGLVLAGQSSVTVCRSAGVVVCLPVQRFTAMPKARVEIADQLPAELLQQAPQVVRYEVQVCNAAGRSAGASNAAYTASGIAPMPVSGVKARLVAHGVELSWQKSDDANAQILVVRRLMESKTAKTKTEAAPNPLAEKQPMVEILRAREDAGGTVDAGAIVGNEYEYTVQRVHVVTLDSRAIETRSDPSEPVNVEMRDVFPPVAPHGLTLAVPVRGADGNYGVDLAWEANTEADLGGYIVYRRDGSDPAMPLTAQPLTAPAFHDAGLIAGHKYAYSISAMDKSGNESARSSAQTINIP